MQAGVSRIGLTQVAAMIAVLATSMIAEARVFSGSGKANRVKGTKKADTIRLRAERQREWPGRRRPHLRRRRDATGCSAAQAPTGCSGGAGGDRLHGGKGRDRLSGGGGNDTLNSVDKRKDRLVSGGAGKNTCRIDSVDLSVVRGCAKIVTVPSGGSGPGGRPRRAGTPRVADTAGGLTLGSATGFSAARRCPTCNYTAQRKRSRLAAGHGVRRWRRHDTRRGADHLRRELVGVGLYGCTADGYLRVTIGSETLDVPVDCTTGG